MPEPDQIQAWGVWLDEWNPGVHLGGDVGRDELANLLAAAVEIVVPDQPMAYGARERWWRAWLRIEGRALDLEVAADRARLAALLARAVPAAPVKDPLGRWCVFGDRGAR